MASTTRWGPIAGCAPRLFDRDGAAAIVDGQLAQARAFFRAHAELLGAALEVRVGPFEHRTLKENPDNYGIYFSSRGFAVPFLWFGLGWSRDDPEGALPSWGASLEVNGDEVQTFEANVGGLREACEALPGDEVLPLKLHRFDGHVELAAWRSFSWLLEQPDQRLALERFWVGYLDRLVAGGLPARVAAFVSR